ncbi:MAG: M20/M25/M40 family metallo-hydrolase, partial [Bdellovibrionales bacterium]|nr:M20/M25/M40 family metallo-hydrolase [Bdellovibrionales bacterium]
PGDETAWTYPPYGDGAGVVNEGKVFGLGASDMKASLASFLGVMDRYVKSPPPVDLFFSFVTEEETSGDGSRNYVRYFQSEHRSRYEEVGAVVGEPTDLQYIEIGNRGTYFYDVEVSGVSCHAAQAASKKTNAPEILLQVLRDVDVRLEEWKKKYAHDLLGLPAVTVTRLWTSESSPNQVPGKAKARWDIRTTPELHSMIESELNEVISDRGKLHLITTPCVSAVADKECHLVRSILLAHPGLDLRAARGANDTGEFLAEGIPAVTYGPGQKAVIHGVNESVEVSYLNKSVDCYAAIVEHFSK